MLLAGLLFAVMDAAIKWIYRGSAINRLFFDDYVAAFERSPFRVLSLTPEREHVPGYRLRQLRERFEGQSTFDVRNAEVCLERP